MENGSTAAACSSSSSKDDFSHSHVLISREDVLVSRSHVLVSHSRVLSSSSHVPVSCSREMVSCSRVPVSSSGRNFSSSGQSGEETRDAEARPRLPHPRDCRYLTSYTSRRFASRRCCRWLCRASPGLAALRRTGRRTGTGDRWREWWLRPGRSRRRSRKRI